MPIEVFAYRLRGCMLQQIGLRRIEIGSLRLPSMKNGNEVVSNLPVPIAMLFKYRPIFKIS